ncbi:putative uncharacterized protein DDB_G0277003 [Ruditapes philippinarum]|uniref:putative uncharacterized protein DDB_G0277003 n=1 Tax=Ruditapes philippinarum TaxID=129788 RepID=UPI00295BE8BC|nr:putative uncharacterized protein DDB_G0277003 [Ruditapes philippinarum]
MTEVCTGNTRNMSSLNSVAIQFFEMVPVRRIQWPNEEIDSDDLDVEAQRYMLSKTVNSDLCQQYPPSIQYQRTFIKKLLTTLEGFGVEICDELYETYTALLQCKDLEEDTLCYKTYTVDEDVRITIQESVNMISFGTTGLSTWQAAQHLAEWALQNKEKFKDRNVLELGCGLGLTGLSVCKQCCVNTYTFTDCHTQVLDLLHKNICHNFEFRVNEPKCVENNTDIMADQNGLKSDQKDCDTENICGTRPDCDTVSSKSAASDDKSGPSLSKSYSYGENESTVQQKGHVGYLDRAECDSSTECDKRLISNGDINKDQVSDIKEFRLNETSGCKCIQLAKLDWENITDKLVEKLAVSDVILAADVVYDNRIIPALVSVLKMFLGRRSTCSAYVASTIRNEDTRDQFLVSLNNEGLKYEQVDPPTVKLFHYDRSVPIEIIHITR